ncbi:MAG: ABC transporter transmembrane domain-containing protein, partial [Syntrophales bacterium]
MDIFKRLLKLSLPHAGKFILAMFCMLIVGAATSAAAFLIKPALDEIFLNRNADTLAWMPIAVIVIYFLKGAANYGQTVLMSYIGQRIITDLRFDLYRHIQNQPLSFF